MTSPTPIQILETLLPTLKLAAAYAQEIQSRIVVQPDKGGVNVFATALSDADLSIQNLVEVALLAQFPNIRFFGEEYAQSLNAKYFRAMDLGDAGDYLVTLDPVDGTRFYVDGHDRYQVILSIVDRDWYAGAIALSPAHQEFFYGLRGQGTFRGNFADDLAAAQPLVLATPEPPAQPVILFGSEVCDWVQPLGDRYRVIRVVEDYQRDRPTVNLGAMLRGELQGIVLRSGQLIDAAAIAFLAQEAGCVVTGWDGQPLPPLHTCQDYRTPALIVATSPEIHRDLLAIVPRLAKVGSN